ncbi:NAD(P)-binding protein [Nonomuraea sp. NPDC048916]|uniref:NAD(P)-binding protein n=1 Tax=Nonomuraea sp. NPDC048916 TaxID=3154232 RepID=UPI0033F69638
MTGHAIVIGGGIGGMAAAVALRRIGWQVDVLERVRAFGEVGAGLSQSPNAMRGSAWTWKPGSTSLRRERISGGSARWSWQDPTTNPSLCCLPVP